MKSQVIPIYVLNVAMKNTTGIMPNLFSTSILYDFAAANETSIL